MMYENTAWLDRSSFFSHLSVLMSHRLTSGASTDDHVTPKRGFEMSM